MTKTKILEQQSRETSLKSILEQISHIYYEEKQYPLLTIVRPSAQYNSVIEGELAEPRAYEFFLKRELLKLLQDNAQILVRPSRARVPITSENILELVDEVNLDLRSKKIFLFSPERVEFSMERLRHYTGTDVADFQRFVLLTNYAMHMEIFEKLFPDCIKPKNKNVQMPAYHHKTDDDNGVTIINIGIGPSNAKTITDHLGVMKPDLMLMIGHAGGLRNHQQIGDFAVATGYLRDDHVLDAILPINIPIIPVPQLLRIIFDVLNNEKVEYRSGCIVTTDNRNWEFQTKKYLKLFAQSRSIAIDMESATIATNGYRYRVPNATLLMISDKPLHGEPKVAKASREFYQTSKRKHIEIALKIIDTCGALYPDGFPSTTMRGLFDPFMTGGAV